jgi:signal transduction histidine kinase
MRPETHHSKPGEATAPQLPPEFAAARLPRYRRLRRNVVVLTVFVTLAPLIVLTVINYFQDRHSYETEHRFAVSEILSNTKRTLNFVIDERRSALALILAEQSYREASSDSALARTLQSLRGSFGGFIDLGLIDSNGQQVYYAGPYDLKGRNYTDQSWFQQVVLRGSWVSDVFMGYRKFPHFIVAFKRDGGLGQYYILRATIDMELINRHIYSLNLDSLTDVFVVNHEGILQTESLRHGAVFDTVDLEVPTGPRRREVIRESYESGAYVVSGYAFIEGTPFVLMVIKELQTPFRHWVNHRSGVVWFLLFSIAVVVAVITYGATKMTRQLREADLRRARAFHDIEYTNKMATIGRMAAGVAHEINNPMAVINEKAGLMKDLVGFSDEFPQREKMLTLVESILKSVQRCSKVTHRLLGFARRMEVHVESIDVNDLLQEVVGFQQTEMQHRNITVNYDIAEDVPPISSDRGQLQQVFLNIIGNAMAAVDNGGRIDISAARRGVDTVVVAITDNGKGISEEHLEHVFEPFFSTKGEFGTGLGLSITKDIVDKLGGDIEVQSEVGKGTRFLVMLPLRKPGHGG